VITPPDEEDIKDLKKVFLDDLPRFKEGMHKNKINWQECMWHKVKFIYDNIEDKIEIVNYIKKGQKLSIRYKYKIYIISTSNFTNCRLGKILGICTNEYKYNIGQIIKTKTGEIEIIEQIRILSKNKNGKGYKYKCLIDGNIDKITEGQINRNGGCNVCYGRKTLKSYNSITKTHPHIAKLLKYPERGNKLTHGSNVSEIFVCPDCGYEKSFEIQKITTRGFSCSRCGDGISYPNKFIYSFLNQLNENYIPEYISKWSLNKRYDNYLPDRNEIWEVHGEQHYKYKYKSFNNTKTLEEEQENDRLKRELAENNDLKYIIIDARKSELEWIKNSIMNIPEFQRYDLSNINWLKCHEFACSSLVKTACNYWNSGIKNTVEIGKLMKLSRSTIINYLKQGNKELKWCDYDLKKAMIENGVNRGKSIIQLSCNGEYVKEFNNITDVLKQLNIKSNSSIYRCCRDKNKTTKGFKWMYKEDYEKYIEEQNKSA